MLRYILFWLGIAWDCFCAFILHCFFHWGGDSCLIIVFLLNIYGSADTIRINIYEVFERMVKVHGHNGSMFLDRLDAMTEKFDEFSNDVVHQLKSIDYQLETQ